MRVTIHRIAAEGSRVIEPVAHRAESLNDATRLERPGGVYAAFGTWNARRVICLSDHFDRLEDSARRTGFELRLDRPLVRSELCEILRLSRYAGARIRLSVHPEDLAARVEAPLLVTMEPYSGPPASVRNHGVACRTTERAVRHNPRAKETGWLTGRAQLATDSVSEEPYEWLLCVEGRILEGASSNFYAIVDDGGARTLFTSNENVLYGISRSIVLEVAPDVVPVRLEAPSRADLDRFAEAFITSASRGVVPVAEIDGMRIGDGTPGRITKLVMERYDLRAHELEEPLCDEPGPRGNQRSIEQLITSPDLRQTLSELGVFVRDLQTGEVHPNRLWLDLGYTAPQMTDEFWKSVIHRDDVRTACDQHDAVLSGRQTSYRISSRVRAASGEWRWLLRSGRVVSVDESGRPKLFVGSDVDVTDRRRAEEALELAKAEAEQLALQAETLRTAGAIVASTLAVDRTVRLVLDQAKHVVPYDTATVQLLRDGTLEVVGGHGWDDLDVIKGLRIACPGENPHSSAIEMRRPVVINDVQSEFPGLPDVTMNGVRSWLGIPLIVHGRVIGLLAFSCREPCFFTPTHVRMTAALGDHVAVALHNARLYEQTRELAMTDSLTGVATRRSFFVQAKVALEHAKRHGRPISAIMSDLDHFKEINDAFGHAKGDEALRLVADVARDGLRRSDIIGRFGGEEFAVILPDSEIGAARAISERLRREVGSIIVPGTTAALSISIGIVSETPGSAETVDALLDRADRALFEAKRLGRNRIAVYEPLEPISR